MSPRRLFRTFALGVGMGLVIIVAVAPVVANLTEPPPVYYTNDPFPTRPVVLGDGIVDTIVTRCNSTDRTITTFVARRLVNDDDGSMMTLVPTAGMIDPGCSTITGGIGLPVGVKPGRYHVDQIVQFEGRWRTFQIATHTQPFTVAPDALE